MNLAGTFNAVRNDELQAGFGEAAVIRNIEVEAGVEVKRGALLAADKIDGVYKAAESTDLNKAFAIAFEDFTSTTDSKITPAYTGGSFHKEKLITSATDTSIVDALELELKKQNILLTNIKNFE